MSEMAPPMTPQKKLDYCLPVVNTPGSSALIKSIVQSARKTGLNSSPVRIPFALSPMAIKLQEKRINFSPVKMPAAKEPSQPIKEAFMDDFEGEEEEEKDYILDIQRELKRPHESASESDFEEEDGHLDKKEKLESTDITQTSESAHNFNLVHAHDINNESANFASSDNETASFNTTTLNINIDHSNNGSSSLSSSSASISQFTATTFPPSNFSTDLLKNLKDPELSSPELFAAIDGRTSRSLYQDTDKTSASATGTGSTSNNSTTSFTMSKSASDSSSKSSNSLLPSGIIKLLEKKRLEKQQKEKESDYSSHNETHTANAHSHSHNNKKKFDLKESLKRTLPYKPHIGNVKKDL